MKVSSILIVIVLLTGCKKEYEPLIEPIIHKKTIDIVPDKTFSFPSTDYQLDINEDGLFDIVFTSSGTSLNNWTFKRIKVQSLDNTTIAAYDQAPATNDIAVCSDGMVIPDTAIWSNDVCSMYSYTYQALPPPGSSSESGSWLDQYDKFLAVRYVVDGEPLYAWVKISHGWGASLIIKEFTYEYR